MTPESFADRVRTTIVLQNLDLYKEIFESTSIADASDPYWKRALALHNSLDEKSRSTLFEIIRQTMVDTISNLFGIIDGVSTLENSSEDFILTSKSDGQKINGDLQDLFLNIESGE